VRDLKAFLRVQGRFALLAILCCVATAAAAVLLICSVLTPDTGLVGYYPEVVVQQGKVVFTPSAPFSPAMESGLIPGKDQIVAVNGVAVASSRDVVRAAGTVRSFAPFPVVVRREGTGLVTVEVTPAFRPTRIGWMFTILFCVALATTAFIISWKLPHETWSVPLVLSALSSLLFTCLEPFAYAHVATNALFNLGNVSSWLLVIFALLFPWERGRRPARVVSIASILVFFAVFCSMRISLATGWLAGGQESLLDAYRLVGQIGNASDGIAYVILGCLLGSASARTRVPRDRSILRWLLAGMLVALPPYFFFDQLPLILGGDAARVGLGPLAQLFLTILPLSLLAGLIAHRAFSFRAFATRYAVYGVLFVLLLALFTIIYLPLKDAIQTGYSVGSPLPELLSVSLIFFLLMVIRFPLQKVSVALFDRLTDSRPGVSPATVASAERRAAGESAAERRLDELRAVLKGVARTLRGPVHRLSEPAALAAAATAQAARLQLEGFVRTLDALSTAGPFTRAAAPPQALARAAVGLAAAEHSGIHVQIQDDGSVYAVCGFQEVARALACALENAFESQSECGDPIRLRISHTEEAVVIEVIDHGCGVESAARRKLFSPFASTKPGHAGLGLCISRAIMERNGGSLDIVPGEAGGTIARFAIPRAKKEMGAMKETV
jgi:signal transduction histidine kinase